MRKAARVRSLIKRILPQSVTGSLRISLLNLPHRLEKRSVQRIFESAEKVPPYLEPGVLERLQRQYPPLPEYRYDAPSVELRGKERAAQILRLPGARQAESFLELGCWDGMVSLELHRKGKNTTAIDITDAGFDGRAAGEGVMLRKMDAAVMEFADESFDFVFSYAAFEHLASPEGALREAIRVVRVNGYIYLDFGPLYYSPFGQHAYRSITVPYCQFLFEKHVINEFAAQNGRDLIDFKHVNEWSLEMWRNLWKSTSHLLRTVNYREDVDLLHLRLIREYPSCFKSKSDCIENFFVENIRVLFQKTGEHR